MPYRGRRGARLFAAPLTIIVALTAAACAPRNAHEPSAGEPPDAALPSVETGIATVAPAGQLPVRASGFDANSSVRIGLGVPQSEYDVVAETRTDSEGALDTIISLPSWVAAGRAYVVVVAEPDNDPRAVSDPFVVGAPGDTVATRGTIERGVECPILRQPGGAVFTLATSQPLPNPGTEVDVVGTIAEVSVCMQGTTLNVLSLERR